MTPPHQSGDGTYYIRLDKEAKPAPHGLVEALFFKRQKSKLRGNTNVLQNEDNTLTLSIEINNDSLFPAEKVCFSLSIYNIRSSKASFREKIKGQFEMSENLDIILWKGMNTNFDFNIEPKNEPFFILFSVWGKDSEVNRVFGTYDPASHNFLNNHSDFGGELSEAYKTFQKMIEAIKSN